METKYYAYYKPPGSSEFMKNIKNSLLEDYDAITVNKLMNQIFSNANYNGIDDYLFYHIEEYFIVIIKFTLVNEIFMKENDIDKNKYTLVSQNNDLVGKKHKTNNNPNVNHQIYNPFQYKNNSILFSGSTTNYISDSSTQYIFGEYLIIPITYIIEVYRELKFDTPIDNTNTNTNITEPIQFTNKFKKSLDKYRFAKMLTDIFIENILILLNNIYKNSNNKQSSIQSSLIYIPLVNYNEKLKYLLSYTKENTDDIKNVWNSIYTQPTECYDFFKNHNLLINNCIKHKMKVLEKNMYCYVYSFLYITQKHFNSINYKDALPFMLSFDTKFRYDDDNNNNTNTTNLSNNKLFDNITIYNTNLTKEQTKLESAQQATNRNSTLIQKLEYNILSIKADITELTLKLSKINPYYKKHLLFNTNTGCKLTFTSDLNSYRPLLYMRYVFNNFNKLNSNLIFCYDNYTDKKYDTIQFYVSKTLLIDFINMNIKIDLFHLSRLFHIETDNKYQDTKYKISNHEINKTHEITNKDSKVYNKLNKCLKKNINLSLFDYQKNNLLWMMELENNIDYKQNNYSVFNNKYTLCDSNDTDIQTFKYNLKRHISEPIIKNYYIIYDNRKFIIDIKKDYGYTTSLIVSLNAHNKKSHSTYSYNNNFNLIENISSSKEYKEKYKTEINFNGGSICDEVGLGKTLTIISHLVLKMKNDMNNYNTYKTVINDLIKPNEQLNKQINEKDYIFNEDLNNGFDYNNIIIVPSRLTSQWESEIEKYVKNKFNLRVKILNGIHSIKALEKELKELKTNNELDIDKTIKKRKYKKKETINNDTISNISSIITNNNAISQIEPNEGIQITPVNPLPESLPLKLNKEEKIISKLMISAKKANEKVKIKLKTKKSTNSENGETPIENIAPIQQNIIHSNTLDSIINDSITEPEPSIEPIHKDVKQEALPSEELLSGENEDLPIDDNDIYYYANRYLNQHETSKTDMETEIGIDIEKDKVKTKVDNNYLKTQLYDIYIVSINLLSNENYLKHIDHTTFQHLNEHYEGTTKEQKQINEIKCIKENSLLKSHKLCTLTDTFNIFKIKWNRIILDEAHEYLAPVINVFSSSINNYTYKNKLLNCDKQFLYENLCLMNANYKWTMTGTPAEQGIDTIMGILQFLSPNKYSDKFTTIEQIRYLKDLCGMSSETFDTVLNTVFKKTFKKDVKTILNIPIFTEEVIYVEQNNIERNIYNSIRASRHLTDTVKNRTLFLMCTNILINNEFDVQGDIQNDTCDPIMLTLEQLNTNMIGKFTQQLKQLEINKFKLIRQNIEIENNKLDWGGLITYINSLNIDDNISTDNLDEIKHKFGNLENNRSRSNCEIFYYILNVFEVWRVHNTLNTILSTNISLIKDNLYKLWNNLWNNDNNILLKCSEYGAQLGLIKLQEDIKKNTTKINTYTSDSHRIDNQIKLFTSNDFLKDKTQDPCIICFDDITEFVITPCRHIFCLTCTKRLSNNLTSNFTCPECRSNIDKKQISITNTEMVNNPKTETEPEPEPNAETEALNALQNTEAAILTPLEKKLGVKWKTNCVNKYGSKMSILVEYLHNLFEKHENRVIIFSQYDKMLKMIGKTLDEFNIKFIYCSGNNYVLNRNINKFKKDESYRVIMLSSESSNSGSNLTEANHIIFIDVLQNDITTTKSIEAQAIGRAVRLGQKAPVKIVRFITKGTIEEEHFNTNRYDINILQE